MVKDAVLPLPLAGSQGDVGERMEFQISIYIRFDCRDKHAPYLFPFPRYVSSYHVGNFGCLFAYTIFILDYNFEMADGCLRLEGCIRKRNMLDV